MVAERPCPKPLSTKSKNRFGVIKDSIGSNVIPEICQIGKFNLFFKSKTDLKPFSKPSVSAYVRWCI